MAHPSGEVRSSSAPSFRVYTVTVPRRPPLARSRLDARPTATHDPSSFMATDVMSSLRVSL